MDSLVNFVKTLPSAGSWFFAALTFFCTLFRSDLTSSGTQVANTETLLPEYDFIIVGGGTAGSVIASRLSERPDWNVLLLEAGGQEILFTEIPATYNTLYSGPLAWNYPLEPQSGACQGLSGKQCVTVRGKVIGGTSTTGAMVYTRGNRRDFDYWASLGNHGWSYRDVLPYFIKSEDQRNPQYASSSYHGKGGLLTITEPPYMTPLAPYLLEAGRDLGYPTTDINGESQIGFSLTQRTMRDGSRCGGAKAFLVPAKNRTNLHIALESHVMRIIIDPQQKQAVGVEFLRHGRVHRIRTRREVILSAGTINSPQILMLSGVGPNEHLQQVKIPVLKDLPGVGQNMQDKLSFGGTTFLVNQSVTFVGPRYRTIDSITQYAMLSTGPLSTTAGGEVLGFMHSRYSNGSDDYPDIQLDIGPSHPTSTGPSTDEHTGGATLQLSQQVFNPVAYRDGYIVYPVVLRPKSRGWIKLRSRNPFEQPIINQNYFSHPDDARLIVEAAQAAVRLSQTPSMQRLGATLNPRKYPGCENYALASDEYWECAARQYTGVIYHAVSTCRMGPPTDSMAVVDPELRVYGVRGLRVADASVMPSTVSANPMAAVFMIGEKVSDIIKAAYPDRSVPWPF